MRRLILAIALVLASCSAPPNSRKLPVDRSNWPVYEIVEPFRIIHEENLSNRNPLVAAALLRVWEVNDGEGWISLDVSPRRAVSASEAEKVVGELFPEIKAAAESRGLHLAYAEVCDVQNGHDVGCLNYEFAKEDESPWTRK